MAVSDYVQALITIAGEENNIEQTAGHLLLFLQFLQKCPDLKKALSHPLIPSGEKQALLETICSAHGFSRSLINFLRLVVRHGQIHNLAQIQAEYESKRLELEGLARVEVTSAVKLDESQKQKLEEKLKDILKKEILLEVNIDESFLAGFRLRYQDTVFDASLKGGLENLI